MMEQKSDTAPTVTLKSLLIEERGWTREETAEVRYQLASFQEDWEAPGMEVYDDL